MSNRLWNAILLGVPQETLRLKADLPWVLYAESSWAVRNLWEQGIWINNIDKEKREVKYANLKCKPPGHILSLDMQERRLTSLITQIVVKSATQKRLAKLERLSKD